MLSRCYSNNSHKMILTSLTSQVGRNATVGENELLRYEPASPSDFIVPLNAIKLETYDTTSDGKWQVPKDIGEGSGLHVHTCDVRCCSTFTWRRF